MTGHRFIARSDNINDLYSLLKPLGNKVGNVVVSDDGLQFAIEVDKVLLIQTWIPREIFQYWTAHELEFSIDLGNLLDSIHVFSSLNLLLETSSEWNDLILTSDNDDLCARISLKKYDKIALNTSLLVFSDSDLCSKIILKSSLLKDVLVDLDTSCNLISFVVSGHGLIIRAVGSFGETEIEFERDANVFDSFDYFGNNQSFTVSFNFCLFKQCLKALVNSKKTCIRINYDGILSMQFMILLSNESKSSFIEFAITPAVSD